MRNFLWAVVLAAGLILPIGVAQAQSTATVTATCKGGTAGLYRDEARGRLSRPCGRAVMGRSDQSSKRTIGSGGTASFHYKPTRYSRSRWRWPSLGQYRQQGISLPRHPLVRQDQAGQLYVRGGSAGTGRQARSRKGLQLVKRPSDPRIGNRRSVARVRSSDRHGVRCSPREPVVLAHSWLAADRWLEFEPSCR